MKSWFKGWLSTTPKQTPEEIERLLSGRSTAEIAARLLRRAELHVQDGRAYLVQCAVLDRIGAENIRKLEAKSSSDLGAWLERRDLCLRLLREGKN